MLKKALAGLSLVLGSTIATKALSLVAFYFVGEYLSQEQLGEYAFLFGIAGIFVSFQNLNLQPLMIQRKVVARQHLSEYFSLCLIFNIITFIIGSAVIIIIFNNELSSIFNGVSILLSSLLSIGLVRQRVKYLEAHLFKKVAIFNFFISAIQYITLSALVVYTENVLAYGMSYLALAIASLIFISIRDIRIPRLKFVKAASTKIKWMLAGGVASNLAINSPYIIIGFFESTVITGIFYFVNQSSLSLVGLISMPIRSVILPLLDSKGSADSKDFGTLSALISGLMVVGVVILNTILEMLIELVWGDKWLEAIPVLKLALLCTGVSIVNQLIWTYSQAKGRWSVRPIGLFLEATFLSIVLLVSCIMYDDILVISVCYFSAMLFYSLLLQAYTMFYFKVGLKTTIVLSAFCLIYTVA